MKKEKQMSTTTRGLFDEEFLLENQQTKWAAWKITGHIDIEFFHKPLEACFKKDKEKEGNNGSRPSYDYVLMFKIVILQRYYELSDDGTEYAILDRLSFMRFLALTISHGVPDSKNIWNFKNEISKGTWWTRCLKNWTTDWTGKG